jgi:hypothetical protein
MDVFVSWAVAARAGGEMRYECGCRERGRLPKVLTVVKQIQSDGHFYATSLVSTYEAEDSDPSDPNNRLLLRNAANGV